MDSIVHFEIPVDDPKRAGQFYTNVFGWQVTPMPEMNYTMVGTTMSDENGMPKEPGAINGGLAQRGGPVEHTVVTVNVRDIDAALAKINNAGGRTVMPKTPIGEMGWIGYFKDTEGNTVGLFQSSGRGM